MAGKAAVFGLVTLVLIAGAAIQQGPRAAVFTGLGCALAGVVLLLLARYRTGGR
ncbi:hypothetical protein Q5530_11270 [Saccharothrix sp. BKS2]|uniref:hypothetical protein n=1 Tax=Saccharothrix sp. BKS2 TaxID=3064400 RepID=UPI0039EB6D06